MKLTRLDEPLLQFGTSRHVDIRFGLMNYCPLDFDQDNRPTNIRVGIIGSPKSIEGMSDWLRRCREEIPAKESRQPNLFPRFPGFNADCAFHCELRTDSTLQKALSLNQIAAITKIAVPDERKIEGVRAIVEQVRSLLDKKPPDAVLVAIPQEFLDAFEPEENAIDLDDENTETQREEGAKIDFHDLLKARCMALPRACPIQLVLPATYDCSKQRRVRSRKRDVRPLQDEATRAWNFHTALYYKAGGTLWKLIEEAGKLQTCFVGVGFYRTLDNQRVSTSVAQVFNERGTGIVVRGEAARFEKEDRQLHLDVQGAYHLLLRALDQYRHEHHTTPARVVIHKTSSHSADEVSGFLRAVDERQVHACEMLWLSKSFTRLFRQGVYPPLRGMCLSLDDRTQILYSRGSVEFYATYPGMYMPMAIKKAWRH